MKKELIGKIAEVIDSKNKVNIGIKGVVEDETKNTIKIGGKILLKNIVTLSVFDQTIHGNAINKRPEERIKK